MWNCKEMVLVIDLVYVFMYISKRTFTLQNRLEESLRIKSSWRGRPFSISQTPKILVSFTVTMSLDVESSSLLVLQVRTDTFATSPGRCDQQNRRWCTSISSSTSLKVNRHTGLTFHPFVWHWNKGRGGVTKDQKERIVVRKFQIGVLETCQESTYPNIITTEIFSIILWYSVNCNGNIIPD